MCPWETREKERKVGLACSPFTEERERSQLQQTVVSRRLEKGDQPMKNVYSRFGSREL